LNFKYIRLLNGYSVLTMSKTIIVFVGLCSDKLSCCE